MLHFKKFFVISIFFFSLYLLSLSIIEKHFIFLLSFFFVIPAKTFESMPPLRLNAIGTSDLVLILMLFFNNFIILFIAVFNNIFLGLYLRCQYFLKFNLKVLFKIRYEDFGNSLIFLK